MSARSRPPTDPQQTGIYDPQAGRARPKSPTSKGHESGIITVPEHGRRVDAAAVEVATPTMVDRPRERSEPLRVISMKTPRDVVAQRKRDQLQDAAREHKAQIRSLAEVRKQKGTPAGGMGYLAPPRDAKEVRARRLRDVVIWGSVVVIVGCAVMLGVWFLAR
ncbi:MAG: hypothetical protein H0X17_04215 [Deltaproteobacteria bacterium]|nr:hypothetical protein [Deltaproteobacteria bacterium]